MADECEYLEYRPLADDSGGGAGDGGVGDDESGNDGSGDPEPRPYCTAADQFVQAMRADICNRRYGLDPETDCEIYRDHEGLPAASPGEGAKIDGPSDARSDDARTDRTGGD